MLWRWVIFFGVNARNPRSFLECLWEKAGSEGFESFSKIHDILGPSFDRKLPTFYQLVEPRKADYETQLT